MLTEKEYLEWYRERYQHDPPPRMMQRLYPYTPEPDETAQEPEDWEAMLE